MMTPYFLPFEYPARVRQRTHKVWVAPVSSKQEDLWGTLSAVITLPASSTLSDRTIADLCDLLIRLYYPSSITTRRSGNVSANSEREVQFEEMLQELNRTFQNPERFGIPSNARTEFDLLVSVIHADGVLIACHQRTQAWFLHRYETEINTPSRLERISEPSRENDFFSTVINGSLKGGETLLFVAEHFFERWSKDSVVHLIDTAKSTEELIEILHHQGKEALVDEQSAALIVLGLDPQEEGDEAEGEDEVGEESPRKATREGVALSMTPLMRSTIRLMWLGARWSGRTMLSTLQHLRESSTNLPILKRSIVRSVTTVLASFLRAILMAWSLLWTIALVIALGVAVLVRHASMQETVSSQIRKEPFARWARIAPSSSLILAPWLKSVSVVLIATILLMGGVVSRRQYQRVLELEQQQTEELQTKATQAQARLIYGNDREAQQLLGEARSLLSSLPVREGDTKTEAMKKELDTLAQQLRHEVILGSPLTRVPALKQATRLASLKGTLVAASSTTVAVYDGRALGAKPVPRTIAIPKDRVKQLSTIELLDETLLLIHDESSVHKIPLSGKASITSSPLPPTVGTIQSTFNNRIYAVDTSGKTILRLNPTASGWGSPTPWLNPPATLPAVPTVMDIDGTVFLASSAGVQKYHRGAPQPFALSLDPPLLNPRTLLADPDLPYLITVDDAQIPRIIVLDKGTEKNKEGGRVVAQLLHPGWKRVDDIAIDAQKKILTVLTDGFIEQYPLPALK